MLIRQSTFIAATASAVWPYVADPVLQADWNPKVVSVGRTAAGPVRRGERFEMILRIGRREQLVRVDVTDAAPFTRVVFQHVDPAGPSRPRADDVFDITQAAGGVTVTRSVDLPLGGVPWLWRPVIWLVVRFGTSAEEPYLQRLKRLVETGTVGLPAAPPPNHVHDDSNGRNR